MKRLGERLARMKPGVTEPAEPAPAVPNDAPPNSVEALRPWWMCETPQGRAHVHRERLPRPACPHIPALERLLTDDRLTGFHPERALYLDIEATGLSHGAGTFAFLIGCAYFEDRHLTLEQLFMPDPTHEMPVLGRFMELIERFPYLVSFNGKSFDLSVLQSRLIVTRLLSRQEVDLKVRPHLDLLHVSRQAYKGVFEDTRLQTLERRVLGLPESERADDVPGSMVPALYFHYLRTGYAPPLDVVLRHNRTDVLSMVSLTNHLAELFHDPGEQVDAQVLYNLGRAALRRRLDRRAAHLIGRAIDSGQLGADLIRPALADLVTARRRVEDWKGARWAARFLRELVHPWEEDEEARLDRQITRFDRKIARLAAAADLDSDGAAP